MIVSEIKIVNLRKKSYLNLNSTSSSFVTPYEHYNDSIKVERKKGQIHKYDEILMNVIFKNLCIACL